MIETIYTGKNLKDALTEASKTLDISIQDIEYTILDEGKPGFLGFIGGKDTVIRVLLDEMEEVMREREARLAAQEAAERQKAEEAKRAQEALEREEERKRKQKAQEEAKKQEIAEKKKAEEKKLENKQDHAVDEAPTSKAGIQEVNPQVEAAIHTFLNPILDQLVTHYSIDIYQENDRVFVNIINEANENFGILIGKRGVTLDALQYLVGIVANSYRDDYVKITLDTENYRYKREQALIALANRMGNKALRENRRISLNPMNPFERRIIHVALQKMEGIATYSEGREPYRRVVIDVK